MSRDGWFDYRGTGLADEHVPALIGLVQDRSLDWEAMTEGEDEAPYWAPVHAWRALGQLRAPAAAEPLLDVLHRDEDNDWATTDIPDALGMIGAPALEPVRDALARTARGREPWEAASLAAALGKIGRDHPEARGDAVSVLAEQLRKHGEQDPELNAFLVSNLLSLRGVEAASVMEAAFAADAVEKDVCGDWEDVQVELGLLAARTTPPPRYDPGSGLPELPKPATRREPQPGHPAARASRLRKAQKKASRRKRK